MAAILAGVLLAPTASAQLRSSFACPWRWSVQPGLPTNFIVAGNQATCSGRSGSLLLSTTLQEWDATAGKWHAVGAQTRVWRALGKRHYTEVRKKCDNGKYRALFTWVLRNTSGRAVSRLGLTTRSVFAPKGCTITIH
jgi:hypothetical protein